MTAINKRYKILPLLLVAFSMLVFLNCAGGKGFRMEIETGNDSAKRIQELQESQQIDSVPQKKLPEPTGHEFERMGDALLNKNNYYLAYVHYEKALALQPDNLRAEYKKGLALLLAEKNSEAIDQFKLVIEKDPQFSLAYEGLGRAHFKNKTYAEAEKNFHKAVELNPKLWKSYNFLGNICDTRNQHDMAIIEYSSAIQVMPHEGFLYNNLGVSYSMAGKPEAAVEAFEMAIERNFRESKVFNNLGLALASLEKLDQAFDAFQKGGNAAQAYNNLGVIYMSRSQYADAVECFEKAIELKPSFYAKAGENLKKAKILSRQQ